MGGALDEDVILGPHKPADGVSRILHAHLPSHTHLPECWQDKGHHLSTATVRPSQA